MVIQTFGEACIYKKVSGSSIAFLILYVDDILLIGNDVEFLDSIKGYMNKSFSMKNLGEGAYILGIKIYRDRSRRLKGLSQSTYLDKVLKKFKMDHANTTKKYTFVMIRVCHSRSRFLLCMYIHDKFMTESR